MFNFEKLLVWQKAIDFADRVYFFTKSFPADERFGLTSRMRRAAISISSNIAEGCSRMSPCDYARFLEIATGSIFETLSQATLSKRQNFLDPQSFDEIYTRAEELSKMLSALRHSVLKSSPQATRKLSTPISQP